MELLAGILVIMILATTLYLLALFLGLIAIIVLLATVTLCIPLIVGIAISPKLGITLFIIEALLIAAMLGYSQFSKARIKKWDERMPKSEKSG